MLVLTRKMGDKIFFTVGDIKFDIVIKSHGGGKQIRVAINAPREVQIRRDDVVSEAIKTRPRRRIVGEEK